MTLFGHGSLIVIMGILDSNIIVATSFLQYLLCIIEVYICCELGPGNLCIVLSWLVLKGERGL